MANKSLRVQISGQEMTANYNEAQASQSTLRGLRDHAASHYPDIANASVLVNNQPADLNTSISSISDNAVITFVQPTGSKA